MSVMSAAARPQGGGQITFMQSLKGKLLLYFLLLSLIPMIGVGLLAFTQSQSALQHAAYNELSSMATVQAKVLEQWFVDRAKDMEVVAGAERVRSMDPERALSALKLYDQQWDIWETLFVAGPDGKTIATSDGSEIDISARAYFQEAMQGKPAISDALVSRATGNVVVVFASPVVSEGKVVGVAGGTVPMDGLAAMMTAARMGSTGEAYLVNEQGYAVTQSRFEDELKREGLIKERTELELKVDTFAVREALAGRDGIGEYSNYRGAPVLGAYHTVPVGNRTWARVVEMYRAEAF